MMKIQLAKNIGFCGGVARAIKKAEEAAEKYGEVQMLGDIVHNKIVVKNLQAKGVKVVEDIEAVDKTKPLLLRAHGTALELEKQLRDEGYFIIDATCPLVKDIHEEAVELENEGRQVVIIGDHGHDEVVGIQSYLKQPVVVNSLAEAQLIDCFEKIGVVVQSTQFIDDVEEIVNALAQKSADLRFVNTICRPTKLRQQQIQELAENNDLVLIVGSQTSANTKRLAQIALEINPKSRQIESGKDLEHKWFQNVSSVGISGGASTPDYVIESIKKSVQKISESLLN